MTLSANSSISQDWFFSHTSIHPFLDGIQVSASFSEILASTYGPGPCGPGPYSPGPLIILKIFVSQKCSRTIFEKHTAPGAYSKHAPGAGCISNIMVLEHISLG